jgi:nucleoside-diphosphate-sugar epimerase
MYGLGLNICASARRSYDAVPFYRFVELEGKPTWQIASAEETILSGNDPLIVVHTACYGAPEDYMSKPMETYSANTDALSRLFRLSEGRLAHMVYFSSAEVYGQPDNSHIPTCENYHGRLHTTNPRSIYGESKRMGEVLAVTLAGQENIPLTLLRPWNLYGPGQKIGDSRVPFAFIKQAITGGYIKLNSDGSPSRSFCYVLDGIFQIAVSLIPSMVPVRVFNIGNGLNEISIRELARACCRICGLPTDALEIGKADGGSSIVRCCPSTGCIEDHIGTKFNYTSLDDGLKQTLEWFLFLKNN